MGEWVDFELNKKSFKNVDEDALTTTFAALENCFVTESNGLSRFPGLVEFADFGGTADFHINRFGNDMIAVGTDGRTFRLDRNGTATQINGAPVLGGDRISFARDRAGLYMAGGAQIIRFDGVKNSILSSTAPLSSFVGFLDGYVLAVEKDSNRFQYSGLNAPGDWTGTDTFSVDGSPDDINSMLITPFNEVLLCGEDSIEQFERLPGGTAPFFRRWSVGDGIIEPWTLCFADNAAWGLNDKYEFSRLSGQVSQSVSDDIQKEITNQYGMGNIGDLTGAWAAPAYIKGQKFIIFQSPNASNAYGTKGFTAVFDIRRGQWNEIFGWDSANGVPDRWPGRSVFTLWGKTFVGGQGKVYQFSQDAYSNAGAVQRVYCRTAHIDSFGCMRVEAVRMTIKRGVGTYTASPKLMFRSNPDHRGFGLWQTRELGMTGDDSMLIEFGAQGIADTWQFEFSMTDNAPFELRRMQLQVAKVAR